MQFEVFVPVVRPRIEERDQHAVRRIIGGDVGAFHPVAQIAGIRQVLQPRFAVVLLTDDVIDMMGLDRVVFML